MEKTTQRAVIFEEGDIWIAQCIDLDINAQGKTVKAAADNLALTIRADLQHCDENGLNPAEIIGPAPDHYRNLWDETPSRFVPDAAPDHVEFALSA